MQCENTQSPEPLGHDRFAVAGHDRGARVTHRLLRDHPDKVTLGATLDIVPTLYRFETIDQKAATGSWHWFFLIQGRGLPEHMIGCDPDFFLRHMFGTLLHDGDAIEPAAWNEYLRCFRNPETIRATCYEYRAGASIDLVHDRADLAQKVRVPMLVLWGMRSGQGSGYDVLKVWRDHAEDVRGLGIDSGHFIPEEQPDRVYAALKEFFS
jgi:haloacetate dehalogenase